MDTKQEQIISGALKRFCHYGIAKTTMNDIAEDLSMSKPSLYYYFPDKTAVIYAVVKKIIAEYMEEVKDVFDLKMNYADAMLSLIDHKYTFSKRYFMLHMGEAEYEPLKDDKLIALIQDLREREISLIAQLLQQALDAGELNIEDPRAISELFCNASAGLRFLLQLHKVFIPDEDEFHKVYLNQKQLARIFINGIKK